MSILLSLSVTLSPPEGLLDNPLDLGAMSSAGIGRHRFGRWDLHGASRQIQDLEQGPVKGDQIFVQEAISGLYILVHTEPKIGADDIIAIEG